jgi:hypothetical protein
MPQSVLAKAKAKPILLTASREVDAVGGSVEGAAPS